MSTRSSRKLHPVQDPTPVLSSVEALILAQAVWEHGANAWPAVAKVLSKHPLISRPKSFSTGPTCLNMYNHLMKEAGLEYNEANYPPRAAANLKLAEKHYNIRLVELRGLILAEEVKFKTVLSEIDEIRSGRWDDEIKAKVTSTPIPSVESKAGATAPLSEALPDEAYEGSDLSGVTDTPASPSQGNRDVILIREPTPPDEEETLDVEGGIVEPLSSLPIKEFSPAQTVDMPVVLPHIATEVPSPGAEDHVVPLVNAVPSEVPASPSSISEAPVKSPVIIHDVTSPSPTAERERDEVCENLSGEVHQHMEQKFANESIQQEQVTEKEEEGGEEGVEEGEGEGGEEEEEEEEEQRDAKEEEEEGEEHGYEDMHTGESDRAPSPVTDVSESTQSLRIDMYQDTALDTASGGSEEQAPATSAVPELETEPEEVNEDETMSSGEEPLQVIRRSTRRRRSSASSVQPLQTRGRKNRRHKPVSAEAADTPPLTLDVEPERTPGTDKEVAMDSPRDEDQDLSPAASEVAFTRRRDGKRKASFAEGIGSPRERKKARDDSEPAEEDEPGPSFSISRGRRRTDRTEEQKRFQNVITMLHSQISQHRNGNIFHNPIKPSEAPDYHDIVKRPIDLKTIKMKVKDGAIASSLEFQRDTYLMFANAMIYNRPGSDVYTMAEDMMLESEGHILAFRQTEGFVRGAHRI